MTKEELLTIKKALLLAQNANQLNSLVVDYAHEEIILVYKQLGLEEQTRIKSLWEGVFKSDSYQVKR